jgi:hypothetical protein
LDVNEAIDQKCILTIEKMKRFIKSNLNSKNPLFSSNSALEKKKNELQQSLEMFKKSVKLTDLLNKRKEEKNTTTTIETQVDVSMPPPPPPPMG